MFGKANAFITAGCTAAAVIIAASVPLPVSPEAYAAADPGTFSAVLTEGRYTAGTDFPAGTYTLTADSGKGSADLSGGSGTDFSAGQGASGGTEWKMSAEPGEVLTVSGTLRAVMSGASADASPDARTAQNRPGQTGKTYLFSSGIYTAGKDFPAGKYSVRTGSGVSVQYADASSGAQSVLRTGAGGTAAVPFSSGTAVSVSGGCAWFVPETENGGERAH